MIERYKSKKGIILSDHDHANLMSVSDRVLLIDRGVCRSITKRKQLIDFNYLPPEHSPGIEQEPSFTVDQQTLRDLGLNDLTGSNSFFSIFGRPESKGGKTQLEKLIHSPTRNRSKLNDRQQAIRFFQKHEGILAINKKQLDFISFYLDSNVQISSTTLLDSLMSSARNKWRESNDFYIKQTGIQFIYDFLKEVNHLSNEIQQLQSPPYLLSIAFKIQEIFLREDLRKYIDSFENKPFFLHINSYDYLLRKKYRQDIMWLLESTYILEAFQAIARSTVDLNFAFPEFIDSRTTEIEITGLTHPQIRNAVSNDFLFI